MDQKNQNNQDDQSGDTISKLEIDILLLTDKVRIIDDKIRKTPWYRVITHLKLYQELRDLKKDTDEIEKRVQRLERIKRNPIQIIKRT